LLVIGGVLLLQETDRRANIQATATARAAGIDNNGEGDNVPSSDSGATAPALGADVDPGDGLLYFAQRDDNYDIFLLPLSGGAPERLTSTVGADQYPMLSPDGRTIAFQSDRNGDFDIVLM